MTGIPEHLLPYVSEQDFSRYTAIDHAAWRFILKISRDFFSDHAHQKYCDGLEETGISMEQIPLISDMDQKLKQFGWRAVPVSGFIPPSVFMEFQSLGILPIAAEMRTLEHLAYTPAPDIVHEAAGHAPILADPEYADYLKSYGVVARKAIYSIKDIDVYEAVRTLSDTKEDPHSSTEQINEAQKRLEQAISANDYVSEATYLSRMFWWTVEYGLVGSTEEPKIYGAGLLSSVAESFDCLQSKVAKLPFTLDCINMAYDITRPQPQLFTTPDFQHLKKILSDFEKTMAFHRGGVEGMVKAKTAQTPITLVLNSGLQVTGVLEDFWVDHQEQPIFIQLKGGCALARDDREIAGQGVARHPQGFSSPLGRVKTPNGYKKVEELCESDFFDLGFLDQKRGSLQYESGITVEGVLRALHLSEGWLTLSDCRVIRNPGTQNERQLYRPEWGDFDLALGSQVVSVFGGAADRAAYSQAVGQRHEPRRTQKTNLTQANQKLNELYSQVRRLRDSGEKEVREPLEEVLKNLEQVATDDWLLRFEILELLLLTAAAPELARIVMSDLKKISQKTPQWTSLVDRGLRAIGWKESA